MRQCKQMRAFSRGSAGRGARGDPLDGDTCFLSIRRPGCAGRGPLVLRLRRKWKNKSLHLGHKRTQLCRAGWLDRRLGYSKGTRSEKHALFQYRYSDRTYGWTRGQRGLVMGPPPKVTQYERIAGTELFIRLG